MWNQFLWISFVCLVAFGAGAEEEKVAPPPDWMIHGFEAALADPRAAGGAVQLAYSDWLLKAIPAERRPASTDKLLPLLESPNKFVQGRSGAGARKGHAA
jgi:hypothetical protein